MRFSWEFLKSLPLALLLPIALWATSVKPEDAEPNAAAWAKLLHLPQWEWLRMPGIDQALTGGVLVIAAIYAFTVWPVPILLRTIGLLRPVARDPAKAGQCVPAPAHFFSLFGRHCIAWVNIYRMGENGQYTVTCERGAAQIRKIAQATSVIPFLFYRIKLVGSENNVHVFYKRDKYEDQVICVASFGEYDFH